MAAGYVHTIHMTFVEGFVYFGLQIFSLPAESPKMILTAEDATNIITVGTNESDMVNEARPAWKVVWLPSG